MDLGIISSRYAKALLSYAIEMREAAQVYEEMCRLTDAFLQVKGLQAALLNPAVSMQRKTTLLQAAAADKQGISRSASRFFHLTVEKGRADMMHFIANSYVEAYRRWQGIIRGTLTLHSPVSEATEQGLRRVVEERVGGKAQVEFMTRVDPAIGGGFILEYGTYRLDASLRTRLSEVRRHLVG